MPSMKHYLFRHDSQLIHTGLALLRVGLGVSFILHGVPKLAGGSATWAQLGLAMGHLGVDFAPAFWGFAAACAEGLGGIALLLGLGTRIAAVFLSITMLVATFFHFAKGDGFTGASHALECGTAFLALLVMGAGRFSLDQFLTRRTTA